MSALRPAKMWRKAAVAALPAFWLALFLALPMLLVLKISISVPVTAQPPYAPLWQPGAGFAPSLDSYALMLGDDLYRAAFVESVRIALVSTVVCLLIGYPMAYAIARASPGRRGVLLLLVVLPFWTSFLIRVYAWMNLIGPEGPAAGLLHALGLLEGQLRLLNTEAAVYLGIVYSYLPFMVLPLYATLVRLDPRLLEAAADLGARPLRAFLRVTLPLSLPGILAGSLLVFIPAVGEFVIPDLLGGADTLMLGKVLWTEFFSNRDWPMASALAVAMLVLLAAPVLLLQRSGRRS